MLIRLSVAILALTTSSAVAQNRTIDEGTFLVSKAGSVAFTESFKIARVDGGMIAATSNQVAGTEQTTSSLTTDTLGTPAQYELHVKDKQGKVIDVRAVSRAGRLASLSSTKVDESMREYPITAGHSLILEPGLLHQLYFVNLVKRPPSFQVIDPRGARTVGVTLTARGLESLDIGGKSVTGTHYSLMYGPARYEFWIDAQGRLLKVEMPSQGLIATREEAPR